MNKTLLTITLVLAIFDARGHVHEGNDLAGEGGELRVGEHTALERVARASPRVGAGEVGEDEPYIGPNEVLTHKEFLDLC